MSLVSAQVSVAADSVLPRDLMVNTLHFNTQFDLLQPEAGTDWQSLANDLADIWKNTLSIGTTREVKVRLYDLDNPKPRPVKAEATRNSGLAPLTTVPREVALALSFYSERNLPRQRGRLFIPAFLVSGSPGLRPTTADMNTLLNLADALSGLGGSNVDWSVYSRLDDVHRKVSMAWVDNEWDTVRSRGLRATTRVSRAQGG